MHGRWPPAAHLTERTGAWISGALFAEAETLTSGLIAGAPALMVHYVSPGSEAESSGLLIYDLLLTADAKPVDSVEHSFSEPATIAPRVGRSSSCC